MYAWENLWATWVISHSSTAQELPRGLPIHNSLLCCQLKSSREAFLDCKEREKEGLSRAHPEASGFTEPSTFQKLQYLPMTVTNTPRRSSYKEQKFIWAHSFRNFFPQSIEPIVWVCGGVMGPVYTVEQNNSLPDQEVKDS